MQHRKCRCEVRCLRPQGADERCPAPFTATREANPCVDFPILNASDEARLWAKIDKGGPDDCWEWTGAQAAGYGRIKIGTRLHSAHRAVYVAINGRPDKGEGYHGNVVMHVCDNRLCCNPAHLVLGTQQQNAKDMADKGRASWITKPR